MLIVYDPKIVHGGGMPMSWWAISQMGTKTGNLVMALLLPPTDDRGSLSCVRILNP